MNSGRPPAANPTVAMHRVFPCALLLAATFSTTARADDPEPDFVPGLTLPSGLDEDGSMEVDEMRSLRFSSALEVDFAVRRGDRLDLLYRPSRCAFSYPLGTSVQAMVPVPVGDGKEGLLVVQDGQLLLKEFDDAHPQQIYFDTALDGQGWTNADRLWAFPRADGSVDVFGFDPEQLLLLRGVLDGGVWTELDPSWLGTELHDLIYLEWDEQPGPELAALLSDSLLIVSLDWITAHVSVPARAEDSIARLRDPSSTTDRLVWTSTLELNSYVTAFDPVLGVAAPYLLPAPATSALPLDAYSPLESWVFALPRSDTPGASVLHVTELEGSLCILPVTLGDSIDAAHPTLDTQSISTAAVGDYDLDGDDDLLCGGDNGGVFLWRNIPYLEDAEDAWQVRSEADAPPALKIVEGSGEPDTWRLSLPMQRGTEAPESYHVRVTVGDGLDPVEVLVFDALLTPTQGPGPQDLLFEMEFPWEMPLEEQTRLRISLTGVELDPGNQVVKRHPTRILAWEPVTGFGPEDDQQPVPQHTEGLESGLPFDLGGGVDGTGINKGGRPVRPPTSNV